MSLIYLDTETTGLDGGRSSVWEIAYAIDDGPILSAIVPHTLEGADSVALDVGHYWGRGSGTFDWDAAMRFEDDLRKAVVGNTLVGANPSFDAAMLLHRWGSAAWHYRLFDIEAYAMPALGLATPKGLAYIADQLEIEAPDHTAAGDVRALRDCHRVLRDYYATELGQVAA